MAELEDVGVNLNGIKSVELYNDLKAVVEDKDYSVFERVSVQELMPALLEHMCETVPEDLFQRKKRSNLDDHNSESVKKPVEEDAQGGATDADEDDEEEVSALKRALERIKDHLLHTFVEKGVYPFTIARICDICYDPFRYFKTYEMNKYVHALEKCCMVETSWHRYEMKEGDDKESQSSNEQNDVALTKISWMDEKTANAITPFIKEIDTIMSVNLTFDEEMEEEEEEQERLRHAKQLGEQDEDFIVEEYYEDDDLADGMHEEHSRSMNRAGLQVQADEDDEDDDDDYIEGDDEEEEDDEEDYDEENDDDQNGDVYKRKLSEQEDPITDDELNHSKKNKIDEST
ncbi:Serine/threonine-protein phosphatase 4 regulatory subunit 2 [Nakaseomyces bracarensis]|uniref:Serine/threonine-protein phosphatase 4 regulatory subunit 2 n=1 Tax=Nakaseomyces bracarensis TaxID=273131 RepID=A0ABR4NYP7_9SACH